MGVNHSAQGTETVTLLNTLCVLTGNIGRPGAAPFSITGQCNALGTRETGFTASMPGYRSYDDPSHRRELAELWGIDERSEEHTSELQSLMRISYAVFCLNKK